MASFVLIEIYEIHIRKVYEDFRKVFAPDKHGPERLKASGSGA